MLFARAIAFSLLLPCLNLPEPMNDKFICFLKIRSSQILRVWIWSKTLVLRVLRHLTAKKLRAIDPRTLEEVSGIMFRIHFGRILLIHPLTLVAQTKRSFIARNQNSHSKFNWLWINLSTQLGRKYTYSGFAYFGVFYRSMMEQFRVEEAQDSIE